MKLIKTIVVLTFLYACNHSNFSKDDHPRHFDKIISSASYIISKQGLDKSVKFVDSAYQAFGLVGIGDEWKRLQFKEFKTYSVARLNDDKRLLDLSLVYADSMLNLLNTTALQNKYIQEYSISNYAKADILLEMGKYQEAYIYFYKGKELSQKNGDICNQATFINRFALLNFKHRKFDVASNLFLQAGQKLMQCSHKDYDNLMTIQGSFVNAGVSYQYNDQPDSAFICYKTGLDYLSKNAHQFSKFNRWIEEAKGVIYQYMGDVYVAKNDLQKAKTYYIKSIDINGEIGSERKNAQLAKLKLAKLVLNQGEFQHSYKLISNLRTELDTIHHNEAELEWYKLMFAYLNITQQQQKIKNFIPAYSKLVQTDSKKLAERKKIDPGEEFYNLQKEYELTTLKQENKINKLYLALLACFCLMAVFIIYLVRRSWQTSRKTNADLLKLNEHVSEQNLLLQKTLSSLEQSQEENKKVMKVVAHDLRSPIGAIVSLADLMLDDEKLPTEEQNMISLIKASGSDSLKFVDDLLNRESQFKELHKEPVNLYTLLTYCVNLLEYKANEKNQKIILNGSYILIHANREKIWRVFSNLITNAIKFSPPKTTIRVNLEITLDNVFVSIKDQGIGIPDEMKNDLFNISADTRRLGTNGEPTFGMGLIISKQIIEAHGGKIWLESEPFQGTVFFVELPIE